MFVCVLFAVGLTETLTIFETKDLLYQFNAGWLYNSQVDEERRKVVDRELVGLRIDGTTRRLIDQQLEDFNCQNAIKPDIGPMIILIPCLVFVLPPLICSVLVLLLWKRRRRKALRATEAVLAARGSNAARKIEDSPSSSSV